MRAGALRHRVTVKVPGSALDAFGDNAGDVTLGTYWADVRGKAMREDQVEDTMVSVSQFDVFFRHNAELAALDPAATLEVNGLVLHVLSVDAMTHHKKMIKVAAELRK